MSTKLSSKISLYSGDVPRVLKTKQAFHLATCRATRLPNILLPISSNTVIPPPFQCPSLERHSSAHHLNAIPVPITSTPFQCPSLQRHSSAHHFTAGTLDRRLTSPHVPAIQHAGFPEVLRLAQGSFTFEGTGHDLFLEAEYKLGAGKSLHAMHCVKAVSAPVGEK
jgi:hypothetical protein